MIICDFNVLFNHCGRQSYKLYKY